MNNNAHKKTEGIGYISENTLGVNIHSCLAVTTDGLVLGLLDQTSYNRIQGKDDSRSHESKKVRTLEEKESFRWVQTLGTSTTALPDTIKVITVCDREGDMYELLHATETGGHLFLIRVAQNRLTVNNRQVLDMIRREHCKGKVEITIPRDSRSNVKEREAIVQLRYDRFEIKRPQILKKNKALAASLGVWVIYAKEENPPHGVEPIEWFLMTNEPVQTVEMAYERIYYYTQRWKIEQFHYVLKSGCAVEKLQERSIDKTTLLVLMYSIISVVIMNMTYVARIHPDKPCTLFFETDEWQVLYCTTNKTKKAPKRPYTIQKAVTYLGLLGGPKRAPSDGPPGLKTVWIGLSTLNTLLAYREWLM
ncbi:MAG: IS4 family transposase [Treponema sp.]|nr:IS4 family transposase [Treponema sp.]